jgi:hypothetical protein
LGAIPKHKRELTYIGQWRQNFHCGFRPSLRVGLLGCGSLLQDNNLRLRRRRFRSGGLLIGHGVFAPGIKEVETGATEADSARPTQEPSCRG